MDLRVVIIAAGVLCGVAWGQQQQQQCQQTFLQGFFQCAQQSGLNPQNLLFFTTNGQQGQRPQNEMGFRQQACQVELAVLNCTERVKDNLVNSTALCIATQVPALREFFSNIFRPYDQLCANPCRQTLLMELRRCYDRAGLDANLFISNATEGRGTLLGTSQFQVEQVCRNKATLMSCLTLTSSQCLEADFALRPLGVDVGSLTGAIDFLCLNQNLYLRGLQCFDGPNAEVLQCRQSNVQNLNRLFFEENVKSQSFVFEYCRQRLDDVACERRAWERKRSNECNPTVLGLRAELECKLMPSNCVWSATARVGDFCRTDNYNRQDRYQYGHAGAVSAAWTSLLLGLAFASASRLALCRA